MNIISLDNLREMASLESMKQKGMFVKGEAGMRKTDTYYWGIIVTRHKINLSNGIYPMLILTKCLNTTHYLQANQNVIFST